MCRCHNHFERNAPVNQPWIGNTRIVSDVNLTNGGPSNLTSGLHHLSQTYDPINHSLILNSHIISKGSSLSGDPSHLTSGKKNLAQIYALVNQPFIGSSQFISDGGPSFVTEGMHQPLGERLRFESQHIPLTSPNLRRCRVINADNSGLISGGCFHATSGEIHTLPENIN